MTKMLPPERSPRRVVFLAQVPKPCGKKGRDMNAEEFRASLSEAAPRKALSAPLAALWWDAKGDWAQAHDLVDELETADGMAVHAYLHRKDGSASNADYWYHRVGRTFQRPTFEAEWTALVEGLLSGTEKV
jgi:hypothetical protein